MVLQKFDCDKFEHFLGALADLALLIMWELLLVKSTVVSFVLRRSIMIFFVGPNNYETFYGPNNNKTERELGRYQIFTNFFKWFTKSSLPY